MKKLILTVLTINSLLVINALAVMPEKVATASENINDTVGKANLKAITGKLAEVLKVESTVVEKAIVDLNLKVSDIVLAKMVAEKTHKPAGSFLKVAKELDWKTVLEANSISANDAEEFLDGANAELAFMMLDMKPAKK